MLIHAISISIVCLGIHLAIMELIFTFFGVPEHLYQDLDKWQQYIVKPLFYCPTCMASFWGTTLHFILGGSVYEWLFVVLMVAFFNTLFAKWVSN